MTDGSTARRLLPLVLLGLALLAAGVGALGAHRAQERHRASAEAALRDYGTFAAWGYQRAADDALHTVTRNAVYPVRRDLLRDEDPRPRLRGLIGAAGTGAACPCGYSAAGDFAFLIPLTSAAPPTVVGTGPSGSAWRALQSVVREQVGTIESDDHGHGLLEVVDSSGGRMFAAWARVQGLRDTLVYGVELDGQVLAHLLEDAFRESELLPASLTGGRPNQELVAVMIETPSGAPLFTSAPPGTFEMAGTSRLGEAGVGMVARATVLPGMANELIIGGLPRSKVPWLLFLFSLAALLAGVAVSYLRRENRLAEERTDFVASVSHELRTPLAQIRLFVETLRLGRARSPEEKEWALATVDRETLRLTRLVENILRFSRAERGLSVRPEPLPLAQQVEAVVESFQPMIGPEKATLRLDVPDHLMVEADPDALRQVLLNFLDNAVKYGPAGQLIRVEAGFEEEWVWLAVSDEGPGVPAGERKDIWNPFRRGRDARGTVATGSGIGLSVVRVLVEAQDGRCRVEEADGGGARFVLELPRVRTARAGQVGHAPVERSEVVSSGAA